MSRLRVFIAGAPRSGTSILQDVLTAHPDLGWINQRLNREPERLGLAAGNRQYDWPLLGDFWFERRYWKKKLTAPAEEPLFWDHYLPSFRYLEGEPRLYTAESPGEAEVEACRRAVDQVHVFQKREMLLGQFSGPARVALLRRVFPEAKFLQLQRDPRSVAIRLSNHMREEHGKALWEARAGWKALMPEVLRERLDELDDTPLNFAGVLVRWWHLQYRGELDALPPEDSESIPYADLLSKPEKTAKRALKFLGLTPAPRLLRYLKHHALRSGNIRMNKDLPDDTAAQLERAIQKVES